MRALRRFAPAILGVAAPLALAALETFHPHPGDLLALDTKTWLFSVESPLRPHDWNGKPLEAKTPPRDVYHPTR